MSLGEINFLISTGKWILNLISGNYIGRLEAKIESLETDSKRKEEVYGELMKIIYARKELLDEKREKRGEEFREKEEKIKRLRQGLEQQRDKIFAGIIDVLIEYLQEVGRISILIRQNIAKIIELKGKNDFDSVCKTIFCEREIDNAKIDLGVEASNALMKIGMFITEKQK